MQRARSTRCLSRRLKETKSGEELAPGILSIILVAATRCQCQNSKGFSRDASGRPDARLLGALLSDARPQDARGHEKARARTDPRDDVGRPRVRGGPEELDEPHGERARGDREEWHGLPLRHPQGRLAAAPPAPCPACTWTTRGSRRWTPASSPSCGRSS